MNKYLLTAVFSLLVGNLIFAQFSDNFSDGNLTENPTWEGNISDFQITSGELQLNAPSGTTGELSIFTPTSLPDSVVWEIYTRLEFNPSDANSLQIFLQIDTKSISEANGYFIELGESGSDDNLKFYRLDNGIEELLAEATAGAVADEPEFRLRITRRANGSWEIETDYGGGRDFSPEAQFFDPTYLGGPAWFGLNCSYTSSRTDKFFFDDISVQTITRDTDSPVLISAEAVDDNNVKVIFDEALNAASAENTDNYSLSPTLGNPISANQNATALNEVMLTFSGSFQNGETYTLTAENIEDNEGNTGLAQTANFDFVKVEKPEEHDILINEIMADPTPQIGLPDAEWIEIYNRSDKTFSLEGVTFSDTGGSDIPLPKIDLLPGEYAVICDEDIEQEFIPFGKTISITNFPALTNGGEFLFLKNENGSIIHSVSYDDNWYGDSGKSDGGWTLEMINPQTPCLGSENWLGSENLNGGTPGRANSVLDESPDETLPDLLEVFPEGTDQLTLTFSEGLDFASAFDRSLYQITPAISVETAIPQIPLYDRVLLRLGEPLQPGISYNIRIGANLTDCAGNQIGMFDNLDFALPGEIEEGNLIINEILFNPETGGTDFLEIQNVSGKILDLTDLLIGNVKDGDTQVIGVQKRQLLFPGELAAFTENRQDILNRYDVPNPSLLIENDLPAFPNEEGNAKLFVQGLINPIIIDDLNYSEDWHHPLLDDADGVSLERIDPGSETDNQNNWTSAAESAGWATPTGINSQFKNAVTAVENFFTLNPKTFTPNDDGFEDFLLINYDLGENGFVANTTIYDAAGMPVKILTQNELLAIEGFMRWDGDTDSGERARSGIYIIYIQMFKPDGEVQEFKLPCVLERG